MKNNQNFFGKLFNFAVMLIVFAVIFSSQGCGANCQNLKFAQVSDAHYSDFEADTTYKALKSSPQILDDVISQINSTSGIDFVMFTGDMINKPKDSQLMSFISHANLLNPAWYVVFGNHDVGSNLSKTLYFNILGGHNKNFCYQTPYYSFCPKKGYKVIGLDTIDMSVNPNGRVSEEELQWLKDELDNSKGDVVLIFTHVPIVEPFPSENHRLKNSYDVKLLLKKYDNPIIVCSGHYHGTKIYQEDNILYINTPSLVSYPNAFRIINVSPQRNKVMVDVYLKETRLKEIQSRCKSAGMGSLILYGQESDRTNTFELPKKRSNSY
jgi:predicted phosphodiesterase